jgi:hypothetical protein
MLVERTRPATLADRLHPATGLAASLHREDRAFFYRCFVLEDVIPCR